MDEGNEERAIRRYGLIPWRHYLDPLAPPGAEPLVLFAEVWVDPLLHQPREIVVIRRPNGMPAYSVIALEGGFVVERMYEASNGLFRGYPCNLVPAQFVRAPAPGGARE